MKKAVVYGGGNIGRGFLGQLLFESNFETVFIDVNEKMIEKLNSDKCYPIKIVSNEKNEEITIKNVSAVNGNDIEKASDAIKDADIMFTSAGVNVLPYIAPVIARGLEKRQGKGIDIIICENLLYADKYLKDLISKHTVINENIGFVEASVGRMVPVMNEEMYEGNILKVWVEPFCTLPVDKDAFKNEIPKIQGITPESHFEYYIQSKLFLHNMGHAMTAYLGRIKGYEFIYEAIADDSIKELVTKAMYSSAEALSIEHNKSYEMVKSYADDLIKRFGNKFLGDTVARVGRDLKRKLALNDRLIGAINLCEKHKIKSNYIQMAVAAALLFGEDYKIEDLETDTEKIKLIYMGLSFASTKGR